MMKFFKQSIWGVLFSAILMLTHLSPVHANDPFCDGLEAQFNLIQSHANTDCSGVAKLLKAISPRKITDYKNAVEGIIFRHSEAKRKLVDEPLAPFLALLVEFDELRAEGQKKI
ncbi:MAG: hypothetical protein HOM11_13265 [Methylococcales bacterium]|jgi:hypothetical protein|nr:hypothetical protein [Methylococcales bacterium]MBT7444031.1 hypothetical protein [Methylococcales bacterium]